MIQIITTDFEIGSTNKVSPTAFNVIMILKLSFLTVLIEWKKFYKENWKFHSGFNYLFTE